MPILLVIFLVATCLPVDWPAPLHDDPRVALTVMLVALLLPAAAHLMLGHWAVASLRHEPTQRVFVSRKYSRLRRLVGLAHFALSLAAITLGWGWFVWHCCTDDTGRLVPFGELLVPLPYMTGVFLTWLLHHDAERQLHRTAAGIDTPFWTRPGHFLHRLRPYLLLVLLPAVLFAAQQTLLRFAPQTARSWEMQTALACLAPLLFLLMPLAVKPALGFRSLPRGRHRDRLEIVSRRLGFRCRDLLLWPTHGTIANAMVLGLLPRARYVVFTDRLLDTLDDEELEAVMGHEVGHVKHGHLLYYAAFFVLSMTVVLGTMTGLAIEAEKAGLVTAEAVNSNWLVLPPMALFAGYLFLVFGFLSRKCERQADLYGAHTVATGRTEGHPEAAGVYAMTRALDKVAHLNGMDNYSQQHARWYSRLWALILSWQHGAIGDRIDFLHRTIDDPALVRRVQRRITLFRWSILLGLLLAIAALGFWLGWAELGAML